MNDHRLRIAIATFSLFAGDLAWPQDAPVLKDDTEQLIEKIEGEVAEIRGLPFKKPIEADKQTPAQFNEYLGERIDATVPDNIKKYYGKVVKKLGLYRGPEIKDFEKTMKSAMTSQTGAYYDPKTSTFHVLMDGLPPLILGAFYSHELHHGLQDQYFGLEGYLEAKQGDRALNSDNRMARQAVVEGEATYVMTIWTVKQMTQTMPPRATIEMMVRMQNQMDMKQLSAMMENPAVSDVVGGDIKESIKAAENIPPYILESMLGAYFKGMNFIFAVEGHGWKEVDRLYTDRPPESTEQILHPEKWFAHESPAVFEWQPFAKNAALKQWQLLDDDVLGEILWRVIFREHGLTAAEADTASAGWNGDRYAVFKRNDSDELLLLWRTSWDSRADADEFAAAYKRVLAVKYADGKEPTRLVQDGTDVLIVEGGEAKQLDTLIKFVRQSKKQSN